ncbi:hypothetical protein V8G54_018174 [Vigna mungo]|uniref:Uncharacterized protein n=1 Tax=Vigna mungo TaxID=3915 RepID=A0AAQ3NA21_VIGMU
MSPYPWPRPALRRRRPGSALYLSTLPRPPTQRPAGLPTASSSSTLQYAPSPSPAPTNSSLTRISYLSRAQESAAKVRLGAALSSCQVVKSSSSPTVADTVFVERIRSRIECWRKTCESSGTSTGRDDCTQIHSKFIAPLPLEVDEFLSSLHSVFPNLLDINYLMKKHGTMRKMTNIPSAISYLNSNFFAPVDLEIPDQGQSLHLVVHNLLFSCETYNHAYYML